MSGLFFNSSFRGASEAREPGIQSNNRQRLHLLDSGLVLTHAPE